MSKRSESYGKAFAALMCQDLHDNLREVWRRNAGSNDYSGYALTLEQVLQGLRELEDWS